MFPGNFMCKILERTDFCAANLVWVDLESCILSTVGKCGVGKIEIVLQCDEKINIQLTVYLLNIDIVIVIIDDDNIFIVSKSKNWYQFTTNFCNRLTSFDKNLLGDASQSFGSHQPIKICNFKNPGWWPQPSSKIEKSQKLFDKF